MGNQIKSILKMRCSKILFILLIALNLISMVHKTDTLNIMTDINNKMQETISLEKQISSLKTIYQGDNDKKWENFFDYCDWKKRYLDRMEKNASSSSYNIEKYYKDLLVLSSIDIDCYANPQIGDDVFEKIKPNHWNFKTQYDFDLNSLNEVYSKSNTSTFIHQRYVDEVKKMHLLFQRVKHSSYIDSDSILGHLIDILKADSLISFLMPILLIVFTYFVLQVYQQNNLYQLYLTPSSSRYKYLLKLLISILISFVCLYSISFILTSAFLIKNSQHTWLNTRILVDQDHIFGTTSYVHSPEKMYFLGNEYYASAYTLFTIPESLNLVSLGKVFFLSGSLDILKILFYTCLSFLCFFVLYKNSKLKLILLFSIILIYCISQFTLLCPILNPFAIIASYSLVCGGYGITWLYGTIMFLTYILFEITCLKIVVRKVDF